MPQLAIVVPVFNSATTLQELADRLSQVCSSLNLDWELHLIDDGSADQSWVLIEQLAQRDTRIQGIRLTRNFGQHHALTAGLDACDADWVVLMDADLQDRPEEIPALLNKARDGFDVVLARRTERADAWGKQWSARLFYRVFGWLTGTRWDPAVGVFRVLSRAVVQELRGMREHLRFVAGLVDWLGFPTASVNVRHVARTSGQSQYTLTRLLRLAGAAVVAHADRPLWVAVIAGFLCAFGAFVFAGWVAFRYLWFGSPVTGWSSLIAAVAMLGGVTITFLGVLGLYVARMFAEVKGRPLYVVRTRVNGSDGCR
jgi:glycosyltransferase involved in cell wall biosynthesis